MYATEGSLGGDTAVSRLQLDFVATGSTVVLAFGGHIASRLDWGAGNSAADIGGSPYHMRMVSFDGAGGNQDRSVQALAVIAPPTCIVSGPGAVCAGTTNAYSAAADQSSGVSFQWTLVDNTTGASIGAGQVPEPGSASLLALGALALGAKGLRSWRRQRQS